MAKKTFNDEFYGKITLKNDDYWELKNSISFKVNNKENYIKTEMEIYDIIYEEFRLGLMSEKIEQFHRDHPELLNEKEAERVKEEQKKLYKEYLMDDIERTCHNIEEAALSKREEMLENETEESFAKIVGKEKSKRVFSAKTREEKLDSLELKRLRVFKEQIEITCTCDWFKLSGGFVIFKDGSVEMFFVDSMSI